jgi:hypothetical protein
LIDHLLDVAESIGPFDEAVAGDWPFLEFRATAAIPASTISTTKNSATLFRCFCEFAETRAGSLLTFTARLIVR